MKDFQMNNLKIYPRHDNVAPFYNDATLILNLSNKELFIETFGLTALEAMAAGLPVIVPTEGGIAEMVEDGVNGYKLDVQELDLIKARIEELCSQRDLYMLLATNAYNKSKEFSCQSQLDEVARVLLAD